MFSNAILTTHSHGFPKAEVAFISGIFNRITFYNESALYHFNLAFYNVTGQICILALEPVQTSRGQASSQSIVADLNLEEWVSSSY